MRAPNRTTLIHARAACALFTLLLATSTRAGLPSLPTLQWQFDGLVDTTPLVLQLTDDDSDGVVDERDSPDVAIYHYVTGDFEPQGVRGRVTVLDGLTGTEHFSFDTPSFYSWWCAGNEMLAAGDLDADGIVELVVTDGTQAIVFEHDGTHGGHVSWAQPAAFGASTESLGIADIDQDGVPEVYNQMSVVSADGSWSWSVPGPGGTENYFGYSSAVDLAPGRPGLELLHGGTILLAADGSVIWENTDIRRGRASVGDLDGDGDPEIVVTTGNVTDPPGRIAVLDHEGRLLHDDDIGVFPSAPTLADMDGDCRPEVIVSNDELQAWSWTEDERLELLWSAPTSEPQGAARPAAFDFDADGLSEIVHHDDDSWFVIGHDGAILHEEPFPNWTCSESPVIADIDGDGETEILVSGFHPDGHAVRAYEVAGAARARALWNQPYYHVTNVNDDGSIPRVQEPPWASRSSWNAQASETVAAVPDGMYAALRASHVGDLVTFDWSLSRELVTGEHFALLKAVDSPLAPFAQVNPTGDTSLEHSETDVTSRLQFFDARIGNCTGLSEDEFPPG